MNKVFVGIPCYGGKVDHRMIGTMLRAGSHLGRIQTSAHSLLPHNFNILFCNALNERANGITHFCMVHADIVINTRDWLFKMMCLAEEHGADVLSVVSPIKDARGLTSTAIENKHDSFQPKRLTMRDIVARPKTFTEQGLLVNSALMLVDIRKPWVESVRFHFQDTIRVGIDGKFSPAVMSEDWLFSRDAAVEGARIFATREIDVEHIGSHHYSNQFEWGTEK